MPGTEQTGLQSGEKAKDFVSRKGFADFVRPTTPAKSAEEIARSGGPEKTHNQGVVILQEPTPPQEPPTEPLTATSIGDAVYENIKKAQSEMPTPERAPGQVEDEVARAFKKERERKVAEKANLADKVKNEAEDQVVGQVVKGVAKAAGVVATELGAEIVAEKVVDGDEDKGKPSIWDRVKRTFSGKGRDEEKQKEQERQAPRDQTRRSERGTEAIPSPELGTWGDISAKIQSKLDVGMPLDNPEMVNLIEQKNLLYESAKQDGYLKPFEYYEDGINHQQVFNKVSKFEVETAWDQIGVIVSGIDAGLLHREAIADMDKDRAEELTRKYGGLYNGLQDTLSREMLIREQRSLEVDNEEKERRKHNQYIQSAIGIGQAIPSNLKSVGRDLERVREDQRAERMRERARQRPRAETPSSTVHVEVSEEESRKAYLDFLRGERWCTIKRDTDLEKNPYYKSLTDETERERFETRTYIYNATNFKMNESGGSFDGMLKNGYLFNLTTADIQRLWREGSGYKGYKEGIVEYVGLAKKNMNLLKYMEDRGLREDVGITDGDVEKLEKHYVDVRKIEREYNIRDFSTEKEKEEASKEKNEKIAEMGEGLRREISGHVKIDNEEVKYYVTRTLVDGVGFLGSGGIYHLEGFRNVVQAKISKDLKRKYPSMSDQDIKLASLEAEQIAFNTHKIFNTFESLDTGWEYLDEDKTKKVKKDTRDELEKEGKKIDKKEIDKIEVWSLPIKPVYQNHEADIQNTRGFQMQSAVIGALFSKGVRKMMYPLDEVIDIYLNEPNKTKTYGKASDWAIYQMREQSGVARKEIKANGGYDMVVLIDAEETSEMRRNCWRTRKEKDENGNQQIVLYAPDVYPPKLFNSYFEDAGLMPAMLEMFERGSVNFKEGGKENYAKDVADRKWYEAKSISGYMSDGFDTQNFWNLYSWESSAPDMGTILGKVGQRDNPKIERWLGYISSGIKKTSRLPRKIITNATRENIEQLRKSNKRKDPDLYEKQSPKNLYFPWDQRQSVIEKVKDSLAENWGF